MPDVDRKDAKTLSTATAVGTNAGVTATLTGVTNNQWVCTQIAVSGDAAALVTVESPASTVLWRLRMAGAFDRVIPFPPGELKGADGANLLVKISTSTSNSEANIHGYTRNSSTPVTS